MQKIIHGDCLEEMRKMADNSIDCIVTDPPYGIAFMGKDWDKALPSIDIWKEALRIAKPGTHMLVAGLPRMIHRMICSIEDAGWEVRDLLMHLFGQGFPKSHNFGKKMEERWHGYGTVLKPAWEGWVLFMKPLEGTFAQNAEKWGVGGLNIDGSRIGTIVETWPATRAYCRSQPGAPSKGKQSCGDPPPGRWPANLILDEEATEMLDEQSGLAASRFFYCAKASPSERNAGLEGMPLKDSPFGENRENGNGLGMKGKQMLPRNNFHPTVKPLTLMQYLLKLVMPPNPDAIILDPFAGSGTTILAAKQLGFNAIGIEKEKEYVEIADNRIIKNDKRIHSH